MRETGRGEKKRRRDENLGEGVGGGWVGTTEKQNMG